MIDEDRQNAFNDAINDALISWRVILGKSQVCPVCFCGALMGTMMEISTHYEHNEPVPELTEEDIATMRARIAMGDVAGNA
jgi:hypothetical protein